MQTQTARRLDSSPMMSGDLAMAPPLSPPKSDAVPPPLGLSSGAPCYSELIDNSKRRYTPIRLKCGVTIRVGEGVLASCSGILDDMNHDLIGCLSVLPPSTRRLIRRTKLWVNRR